MKLTPSITIIATTLAISGCAAPKYKPELKLVTLPPINTEATAEIGQTIISRAFVKVTPAILLTKEIQDPISSRPIPAGLLPLTKQTNEGKFFDSGIKSDISIAEYHPVIGAGAYLVRSAKGDMSAYGDIGIFVPNDKTLKAVVYTSGGSNLGKEAVTEFQETTKEEWSEGSFKRELVYTGISQSVISILYREFSNDLARPAFSQEIKYDLAQGKIIGYKGSRFDVIKATNTEITYKLIKPID